MREEYEYTVPDIDSEFLYRNPRRVRTQYDRRLDVIESDPYISVYDRDDDE
jgi:hypothetical protein